MHDHPTGSARNCDCRLVPTLCVGTRYAAALRRSAASIDAERRVRPFPRRAWERESRQGGIYIVVLGTSLIVAALGLSALVAQRIQNRMLTASADVQQAQLNAHTAVQLALLTMKQDTNWRTSQTNGSWFTGRGTRAGTCSLSVTDPIDANLADDAIEPIVIRGIGYSGKAEQRYDVTVDPRREPLSCLRSGVAVGDDIQLQNDTLRTNGLITADQFDANPASVYGNVEAVQVQGSTYFGTTTVVQTDERPAMPDWSTVFDYYRTNGTEININTLPSSTPNLGRNVGIENTVMSSDWTGTPPGIPSATISQSNNFRRSGTYSLRVQNRSDWYAGAAQSIDSFVKSGGQYYVEAWVYIDIGDVNVAKNFHISLYTKGTGSSAQFVAGSGTLVLIGALNSGWTRVSATLTPPSWSGDLEYAFVKVGGADSNNNDDFYVDDLDIRDVSTTGRFIYRQVLSPTINPFGATTNSQGIYWIDCGGNDLIIERSRILGTLLVVNPGGLSCIGNGPIYMSPAVPGYPALLVDADSQSNANFSIRATNRALSEKDDGVDYNLNGIPGDYIYPCEINGLVAVAGRLQFENSPLVRGQIIVGDDIPNSSGTLEIDYQPESLLNPPPGFWAPYSYVRRPISARKSVLP